MITNRWLGLSGWEMAVVYPGAL